MNELVTVTNGEAVTSTLIIAEGAQNSHKAVIQLVRKYQKDLEEVGGQLTFEMGVMSSHGAGQKTEYALLDEPQTTLLFTFMQNTDIVRAFKVKLVKAFYAMREMVVHGNNQPLEAMVSQIVSMVVPAVIDKVMPVAEQFENKLEQTRSDFSHYSSVSGFYHMFCQPDSRNVVVLKDKLYDVYRQYCEIQGAKPFAKPYFCGKFYRAVTNCTAATVTLNGRRVPAVRGISLLPGWPTLMVDIKRQAAEKAARELAERRKYYFGIEPDSRDEVIQS